MALKIGICLCLLLVGAAHGNKKEKKVDGEKKPVGSLDVGEGLKEFGPIEEGEAPLFHVVRNGIKPRAAQEVSNRADYFVRCGEQNYRVYAGNKYHIQSPLFHRGGDYANNANCPRSFSIPANTSLRFECKNFNLNSFYNRDGSCSGDAITVWLDGRYVQLCGRQFDNFQDYLEVDAVNRQRTISFDFNSDNRGTAKGFSCTVEAIGQVSPPACPTSAFPPSNCACGIKTTNRVVNGNTASQNEWPWQVALVDTRNRSQILCGGTLINERYVLTAAHCIVQMDSRGKIPMVLLGKHQIKYNERNQVDRSVVRSVIHPNYNRRSVENDFAIVELASPVTFNDDIRPACLPTNINENYVGNKAYVTGWGKLGEFTLPYPNELREAEIQIRDNNNCGNWKAANPNIPDILSQNKLCGAGARAGVDACEGDSGGPLVRENCYTRRWEVIGVTSFGNGCGSVDYPGVYARVNRALSFIRQNTPNASVCRV